MYRKELNMFMVQKNMYFTVSILSSQNEKVYGNLHSSLLKNSLEFHDLTQLVLIMDQLIREWHILDLENMRTFLTQSQNIVENLSYQQINQDNIKEYLNAFLYYPKESQNVFLIKVMYYQNFTWQGEVQWINQAETQYFRSTLELLKMINSIL